MKVLKFGGTSVGTINSLTNVKTIVEGLEEKAIVVVSALGGLTDNLIATATLAAQGDQAYKENVVAMTKRHHDIINALVPADRQGAVKDIINQLLGELSRNYDGLALIGHIPEKTLNTIVSFGERMSSVIVSNIIHNAVYFHSPDFIKTEKWFNKNIADTKLTNKLITDTFNSTKWDVAVTGGFISTDRDSGEITNLGRGGSDYTAAIIAAALDASILEIWTDVDGFMTADPRIIPQANVMSHISFIESMELCSFGAKVIYPPTIYPVFHKNIPIKILNTFNPTAPGTLIDDKSDNSTTGAKGISAIRNTTLIQIVGSHTQNVAEINSRTFNAMAKNGISVYLVTPPAEEAGFAFAVSSNDADKAIKCLNDEFSPELAAKSITSITSEKGLATVAIVGENIGSIAGIGPRIFNSLQRSSIQVLAYSDGTSSTTISFVIHENKVNEALKLIHASFFE